MCLHLCLVRSSVCLLAHHQDASVSRQAVFVEWFVIILGASFGQCSQAPLQVYCIVLYPTNEPFLLELGEQQEQWEHMHHKRKVQVSMRLIKTYKPNKST